MSTQPTDEEIRELWSQYNPLHGIQSFARSVLVNWGTPSGDAEPQWLLLTPELLTAIESGDHGTRFWIVSKWLSEPEIGEYEWRQGRGPHGFNTHDSRLGADEVTHVMPYRAPKMPAAEIGKEKP